MNLTEILTQVRNQNLDHIIVNAEAPNIAELANQLKEIQLLFLELDEHTKGQVIDSFILPIIKKNAEEFLKTIHTLTILGQPKEVHTLQTVEDDKNKVEEIQNFISRSTFSNEGLISVLNYFNRKGITLATSELNHLLGNAEKLLKDLQDRSQSIIVEDYAKVFSEESETHSRLPAKGKMIPGLAQFWILGGVLIFAGLFIGIVFVEPIWKISSIEPSVIIPSLLKKSLFLGLSLFALRFCFRQYRINRHLSIVNKQKANALNSYRLFAESIGEENPDLRQALTLEIAKAIFASPNTGHLLEKEPETPSISVIEFTKFLNQNK